ncbi:VCBS domain-containing protein [Vibrio harveyi]|uniref:VCBS domain-containing protein n=1 Tax=Vibrio harveyi TaxID=669 RepID=UPI0023805EAF|nr:VCBS domain-containing protein [Vibrio harveyi]
MENSDKLVESSSTKKNASLLHEDKNLNEGGTEEVKALAPTPSHHLASHSHPIIHRLTNVTTQPSISNTIDSNTQTIKAPPTHTNPTTPQSQTYVEETIQGTYGQLHVDKNGNYQFTLAAKSPAYLLLQKQEPGTDTFTVHLTDGTKVIIQVPVMGKQDSPTISGQLSGHLEEDHNVDSHGFLTTSGKVDVLDPDHGESELIPDTIHGQFGSLSINSQGYWQYTVDNSQSTIQALTNNTSLTETFTIHTKDGTPQVLQMSIGGENDNALVSGNDKGQVYEDLSTHITGKLSIRDADTGEDHFSNTDIVGSLGTLHLTNSGQWTYDLDNTNPTVQALGKGSTVTDTITVHSVDGTPHQVIITINGTNDAAVVSSATVAVDETDKAVTSSGTLTSTDVDNPDNAFTPDSVTGTHGSLTIDANGHWEFTANSAFNQLNVGDKVEETFTVTSVDGTPSTIKITISGTNDAATVSSATVAVDETDTPITASGTLTSTDVDNSDNAFTPDSITGTHGALTIDTNGHWVFTANSAFNQLNVGDKVEETFTVTSVDGTSSTIKVTINGTNDAATVSSATVAVDETDSAITTSGILTSTDVDNPDNTFTPDSITGTHGDLTIDAHGHWVFTANSAFNQLNVGDKVEETFTVASVDGTPSTIKVTINGTNDAATVSSTTVAVDETDTTITTSGNLTSTDVDNPDNTFTPASITGTHGDLTIDAHGHWVFTANSAFNQLNVGDKVEESFTVTSVDGTPSTIKVTINGTNDAATVSSATVAVDETDSAITTSGTLTSTDVDNPDNAFTPDSIKGTHGDLIIDANGHWIFTANSAFNQLNVGDNVEETFTVTSVDGTQSTIKVTINGTNDAATVTSATVAVDETNTAITTSGTLTSTDVDNPDNAFTPHSITGTHGDLTIDANGHWVFTANSAFNQLNVGDKVEESFTVTSVDGTPSTIKVTINGTNDAATVSSATVAVDETDSAITTSGVLTSTDVDNPDNAFTPDSINGTHGDLIIDANGHWVFTANNAFNQLNVGDKVEETFAVTSVDGTPSTIKVTINGTNDAATVSRATVAVDETDKAVTTFGTLTSTDVDNQDNAFTASTQHGTHGDLTLDGNGHWVFTANSEFNQLNVGDKVEETFTVTSVDGTPSTIKVTINGTNDAATVSSATVVVDETDTAITTSGTLTSTDVDNPDNAFTPASIAGNHGDLTIDSNGHWVFTANSAFNQLNVGDKVDETFTVASVDGTQSTIKVTINGTNDRPTISGTSSGAVIEQGLNTAGTPDATGSLTATDLDKSDTVTWAINQPQGQWGTLSIDQNGHWHYQLNNSTGGATDKLAAGEHQSESFWITATDSAGATVPHKIVIDVQGSNDKPIVSAWTQLPAGKEDQPVTIKASDLLTHASDVDSSDVLHVTNLQATHGSLTDNKDGTYTFTPDKDFNGEIRLTYDVVDGHGGSVSTQAKFDLTAAPDNAIISDAQTNADLRGVTEDRGYIDTHYQLHYDGKLNIQDPDAGEAQFDPNIGPQTYQGIGYDTKLGGHILLMRDGHYTYTLDNRNIQNLAQGEVKHDSAVIRSADGTTHTIELTVHGTNDAPTISAQSHSVTEGGSSLNGQMVGQDIDTGATLTYSAPQIDGLVVNPDGSYSFNPAHSSYQSLASGVTKTLTVPVTVTDEHNASSTQNLSITITGVNNSAVIGGVDTGDVTEGNAGQNMSPDYAQPGMAHLVRSTIDASGKLTIADTDTGEAEFDTHGLGFNYSGQYGDLLLRKDGTWFYHADTGQIRSTGGLASTRGTTIDQLGENQTLTDTITVYSKDGTSHDIVITIHGSNDRPYCASEVQLNSGKEDLAQTITATELLANTVDVDANDAGKLTIANLHADHGSIQDNHDGTYTFTPDKDYNGQVHFTYDVKDAHSGTTHTGANMALTPTGDAAHFSGTDTGSLTEDKHVQGDAQHTIFTTGVLDVVDPDAGEDHFRATRNAHALHDPYGGTLTIGKAGDWSYSVPNGNVQHLGLGESAQVQYEVQSAGGDKHVITLTIHGTNDTPTLTAQSHSVIEDGQGITGQMQGHDTDHSSILTYSIAKPVDGLTFNVDGSYSFDPTNASYNHLPQGKSQTLTIPVTVTDEHGAASTQNLEIVVTGTNDAAKVSGVDTSSVHENQAGQDMSPDFAQPGMSKISHDGLMTSGQLSITDPDSGEAKFDTKGGIYSYHGQYGHLLLREDGHWDYKVAAGQTDWLRQGASTTVGSTIDKLGAGEALTDTITIQTKDGTTHDIVITIHGDNDAPYVSGEVQLNSGKEDLPQIITQAELLANSIDVDHNDIGQLNVANLYANHGSILDNKDGTYTFTPDRDYNGKVHFTYDVKDAHGGTTHTGASTTLVATPDKAIISEVTTGRVIEDGPHATHNNGTTTELANGQLQVIDPDSGEDKFQYSQFGETRIHDPFGGMLRIDSAGNWGYSVDNAALQHLAQGQVETVTYRVHSFDGTAYDLNIDVVGTNDAPTVTKVVLSNGTEDINYQMQASQFGFTDVDTGDTLHSIAITDLPPAAQGKFLLDGHDITAGQSIAASDIAKLQFVPTPNFNGDVQFKFTVNDGHVDSQEATNTLHIDAVSDAAQFTGRDTGDVHEGHTYTAPDGSMSGGYVDDRSPDHMHGNIGKIWNDEIHTDGHLSIVDPDSGESHAKTGTYQGTHGHVILQSNGDWSYYASIGQDATGRKIDHLGQGESITDTVTVKSADGTTHDIHITIHGDNDRPYCSSEVQLNSGKEDLAQTITTTELLANTVDVDTNDAGQLSIANLHADHGTLVDNKDGTFTFTPDHNFNGKVHFTYDVKDAHGGVTHTGASTTLLPSNDAATLQPTLASNFVTEDHLKSGTSTNELWSGWKNLDIQDIDSPSEAKVTQIEVNGVKHTVPANFAMNLAGAHGTFNFTHSTDGHDKWSYSADNSHAEVQSLSNGDSLTDTITLITADGTRIPLTAKILGTDDHVIIDSPDALTAALGTAIEDKVTSISGTLLAHDSDSKDSVTFTAGNSVGAYGTLHVDSNGQWHYDLDHSKANALQQGETKAEGFDITAISTDGSTATKHIEVLVQGSNDKATIYVTSNPDVYEDRSSTPVEIISGKLSALDPDHDQSAFSTDVGKRHDPFNSGVHGGLNISKDGSWTYTVNNSQIQQLAAGQEEHVQYNVHTVGGDYHVIDIKIVGTNDIPTVSATTLAHGTEDTHYQMQASQFGFTDIDTGDTLHSIAITDLPPATQGKFVLDGHDITAGQSIATADIAKLQFVPATDFNGDVQFKFTVNDGHANSAEATNTLHIDAVGDAATISGADTGSVTEDRNVHPSVQGNYSNKLEAQGHLTAIDPDAGESGFDYHTLISAPSHPNWAPYQSALGGELEIDQQGRWHYYIDNRKPEVQSLGAGETLTDTVTIQSKDGTPHVITLTINGTNDDPVLSVTQTTPTTGTLTETDVDVNDTHTFSVVNSTGQFGSLSVDPDSGAYVYTANGSVAGMSYNAATHTYHGTDVFEVKVADNHGGESSKFITFDANGHVSVVPGQSPTISTSVPSNPLVTTTQPSLPAGTNTPPNNAVTVDLAASSDTGTSDTDNLTKDSTPTITGHTDIPYSQVTIYDGSTPIGHAVSDGLGQYSVAVSSLSNGDHNLSAKALAPSSVLPATSSILPLHVDTVVAPLQVSLTHDTGSNSSDLITHDGSLTITGQETGATVEYSTDNGHTWTSSFTPQQGSNTVSVRQTDIAGNVSTPTSLTFTYDAQTVAPSIDMKASTDSGVSTTDDLTNIHTPIITGTAEANSAISITDETGKVIATGTANSSGVYQLTTSDIAEGKHTLTVSSTDVAGNQSSASLPIEVDYTAPTISNVNLKTETTHQPTFSGTVSLDTTSVDIVIKSGSTIIETLHATLDGKGGYSVDATNLPDHSYTAYIQATDKAGNSTASGYAGTFDRFSIDTHASAPTISFESTGADNLYNATEVASGAASTITGTIHLPSDAHPKDTLTINGQSHQITDAEFLAKSVNIEVAPGASITASITDKNGNTSTVTNATAPSADITVAPLQVSLTHDTGGNSSDLITNDGSLTIAGQEAGATVEYSTDNGHTWTSSFTPQQGSNTVSVRQTDAAGNVSASSSLTFTLDNTATAPSVSLTSDSGSSSSDNITNVGDLTIGGIEQGATVEYSTDSGVHWSTQFTPNEGVNNVQVRQTDVAGNVSPSASLTYTLDTQTDIRVNSAQVDQHGQGMMVQVYLPKDSEVTLLEITSDGGGAPLLVDLKTVQIQGIGSSVSHPDHQYQEFVGIDLSSLPDGNLTIRVAGKDAAGNTVTAQSSAGSNYVLDTTASVSDDTNTAIEDSTIPVSGNLLSNDADATTVTTTGDIQGTYGTFHLSSDGSYTYTLNNQLSVIQQLDSTSSPLVDSIAYTARDNHGNQATAHLAISIQGTDDNHAPVVTAHSISTDEDQTHTFNTSEFGYSDADGDALNHITITQLPTNGTLMLNGVLVTTNQQISKADLDAGHLTFTPIHDQNGANYANIGFTANDGHQDSTNATMILNVNAVNDDPTVGSSFKSSPEDTPMRFTKADFKYSDVDGDPLSHITITNVAHGTLSLNGHSVSVGDDVSAADVSSLVFTPTLNYSSAGLNGLGAVQFTANDGHTDSKEGSIFINIAPVDDPATFTGDSTGQAQEDLHTQTTGVLNAIDPDGTQGFIAVQGGAGIVGSKGYGHAHIDSNGHWTYNLYNNHAIVQQLKQGQTDTETITVQAKDGTTHDIVITITGTNDAPTVSEHIPGSSHSVNEDTNQNATGQLDINDIDGDAVGVTVDPSHSAQFGSVQFDSQTNTWAYHLDNANPQVDALNDGDTLTDRFTLLVDDGHGGKVSKEIVMTINGHTDPVPYTPPTISVTVDTRNAHHVTAGITASTVQAYAHSIGQSARTVSGHHEIEGHGQSEIYIVQGSLHDEAELKSGNDILYIGGRLTDEEIEGGSGRDTLILGAYNRNNAPRLHSDKIGNMEIESIENIILGDGTVLKGQLPPNFPSIGHDHYEVPVNIQAHLSSSDDSVSIIRLTHLQQGLTLQSNGHNINANQDGSYTVPANGHFVVISTHPISSGHHYFETEVTTYNSVTGVTAVTTEDLHGHIQSHVNPPPPPPPVQHDEPDFTPLDGVQDFTVTSDVSSSADSPLDGQAQIGHEHATGAAAYLDALGITPPHTDTDTSQHTPADLDIVLAQVDQQHVVDYDQAHLDMSDALEHHDAANNQDDEHHHHNDVDGLPDIDPNN